MSDRRKLDDRQIADRLTGLSGWELAESKIRREFHFEDFVGAFRFMAAMALVSEKLDHHPDWSNVYNRVTVELTTHDSGGLTALDFEWASRADALAG